MTQQIDPKTNQKTKDNEFIRQKVAQGIQDMEMTLSQHGIDKEQFQGAMIEALVAQPQLLSCDPGSVYKAIRKCCQDGLVPDGVHATIHKGSRKDKDGNWINVALYVPMRDGLLRILHETLNVEIEAGHILASEADSVEIWEGTGEWAIRVKKNVVPQDDDEVVGAWAIARIPGKRPVHAFLNKQEIEEARSKSASWKMGGDSPWGNKEKQTRGWSGKMAEKSAAKSLANKMKFMVPKANLRVQNVLSNDDDHVTLIPESGETKALPGGGVGAAASSAGLPPKQIEQQPAQTQAEKPQPAAQTANPAPASDQGQTAQADQEKPQGQGQQTLLEEAPTL